MEFRPPLCILAITLALGLVAVPQEVRANACKAKNINPNTECVISGDIKQKGTKSLPTLRTKDRKDEAGTNFATPLGASQEIGFAYKVYAKATTKVPAPGLLVVTASATLSAPEDVRALVICDLTPGDTATFRDSPHTFGGSVDWNMGILTDSIALLTALQVNKGKQTLAIVCKIDQQVGPIGMPNISFPTLNVQYFPSIYDPSK